MADGYIEGDNLICGVHGWDYRYDTGVSEYNDSEVLHKFNSFIEDARAEGADDDEIESAIEEAMGEAGVFGVEGSAEYEEGDNDLSLLGVLAADFG